ncbi:MAG: hypothetical protein QXO71_04625 [Candidatus Jordarchaeaceae archaeon]
MEGLLGEALEHIEKAKTANDVETLKLEAWMARTSLELFLVKLALLHGLEERDSPPEPKIKKNETDRNLKLLSLAEQKIKEALKHFGEKDYVLTYEVVCMAKIFLTKIVTSTA